MTQRRLDATRVALNLARSNLSSFIMMAFRTLNPSTPYLHNWHIDAIAWHLEQVRLGKIKRLIICLPPRSLKSISASIAFPAFVHGRDPSAEIIVVSYAQDFATKLHNDYRTILQAPWYQAIFPNTKINRRKDSENEVTLVGQGSRFATSIGGVLTGRGADIIIIDDPLKPEDAMSELKRTAVNSWFGSTLLSRLNHKKESGVVIVTQRLHVDDLVGHVLETSGEDWTVLELPAIATCQQTLRISDTKTHIRRHGDLLHPEREDQATLDRIRREIGAAMFEAQYQQCPAPPGGLIFKADQVRRYETAPALDAGDTIIQSWDTASKGGPANDWSVCTTWLIRKNHYFLIDLRRGKFEYPALRAAAIEEAGRYQPRVVLVEDAGVGIGLVADLKEAGIDAIGCRPEIGKFERASIQSAKFESGRVLLPISARWLPELETELFAFPVGKHDDQVDSITQALTYEPEDLPEIHILRWHRNGRQEWIK